MSELGTGDLDLNLTSSDVHSSTPSSFAATSPLKPPLSPSTTPSSPPPLSPSSFSPFSPSQVLACTSTAAPDTAHSPDLDDPFLVNFADLDGLLKDSALFDIPSSSDVDFVSSFPDPGAQDPLFVFSDCPPVSPPTLSPSNDSVNVTDQTLDLDSPTDHPSPLLSELFVRHDHSYTSEQSTADSSTALHLRKRKASETESLAASPSQAKKQKMVKDEKYHIRRQKNNVASQISRAKRRAKHVDMFSRVKELEETNARLKAQISEMEAEAARLRKSLVTKLAA